MAKKQTSDDTGLRQLKQALRSGEYARLYFFYGEERYLQEYYMAALRKKLVSGPMEEFNYRRLTAETFSLPALLDAVEAMPMMAEYTLVQVDDFDPYAQNEETREKLMALFSDLPETCCLVFYYDTVAYSRNGKMKKLAEVIAEYGCEVEFAKQDAAALSEWITRHFREQQKTISPELCQYLIFLTGGSMTTLSSEIGKVAAYSRGDAVTRTDIDSVVEPVLSAVMFDITDALAEGDYDKALARLRDVLQSREEPIAILAVVGGHFRRLLTARTTAAAGKGADTLMTLLGTKSDYFCRKIMSQAGRLSENFLRRAVEACFEADCRLKSSYDEGDRVLEMLLLSLSQEAGR